MIWVIDSVGAVTYIGPEWDQFVTADGRLPLRERLRSFVHPQDRDMVLATVHEAQARRLPFNCVYRFLHKDGTYRRMLTRGVPTVQPSTGELVGLIGTTYEMAEGDMTATSVGWTKLQLADRQGLRSAVDRIADHFIVARAMAEQSGETRLVAIADQALKKIFEPYGFDPTLRQ